MLKGHENGHVPYYRLFSDMAMMPALLAEKYFKILISNAIWELLIHCDSTSAVACR